MFVFHFKNFVGHLDIDAPIHNGTPPNSPILIFYKEKEDLSKHEILRRFSKLLFDHELTYIRPLRRITSEWNIDLREFKHSFECLSNSTYLNGQISIEPEYFQETKTDEYTDEVISEETLIKFSIYPEDVKLFSTQNILTLPEELTIPLKRFRKDFDSNVKCGFLIMKFEDSKIQKELESVIKSHCDSIGIKILRADDKWYADDVMENIKTYMHGCSFGIALFDRIKTDYFNPNVSLEIGYMMALNKPVLLLKDDTLKSLPSDLVGKLYHEFDFQAPSETIPRVLDKWLSDKEI